MFTKILNTKAKKLTVLFLSLTLLVSTVAIGLNATLAAFNQESATFTRPDNGYSRELYVGDPTRVGAEHSFNLTGEARTVYGTDTNVFDYEKEGTKIDLTVKKAGTGTLMYATANGSFSYRKYQVINESNIVSYTIESKAQKSVNENASAFAIPITVKTLADTTSANNAALSALKWESSNDAVATVSGNTVTPKAKGIANLKATVIDPWGVFHDIYFTLGVGINIDDSLVGNLIDAIKDAEKILNQTPPLYTSDTLDDLQTAVDEATATVNKANPSETELGNAADNLQNAVDSLEALQGGGSGTVITGDDGNSYKEVPGTGGTVVEKTNPDGSSKTPPEYLYDPDGSIVNEGKVSGDEKPAYNIGDNYYVEDPAGSGILKPIDSDGSLIDAGESVGNPPVKWVGEDGISSTSDDKNVIKGPDGIYYADMGQNVFKQLTGTITGDGLIGGGTDKKPWTDPATPIYKDSNGKYYVKSSTETDPQAYYGDPANGDLDSTQNGLAGNDVAYYIGDDGNMTTTKPTTITQGMGDVVAGQTITTDAGTFVEIARNGDYSLILRTTNIQASKFRSSGNAYSDSEAQRIVSEWFYGGFSASSTFRDYVVTSDVMDKLGTYASMSAANNYSVPTGTVAVRTYEESDTANRNAAFLLSFGEAAQYCSSQWYNGSSYSPSSVEAKANWATLTDRASTAGWLRSPGASANNASHVGADGYVHSAAVTSGAVVLRPALWVKSSIFNESTVTVTSVTVTPATATVSAGGTQAFTAAVSGTGSPAQTVTWTVTGSSLSGTKIDTNGTLTVAASETATSLTITAKSTVDTAKSGVATVTVGSSSGGGTNEPVGVAGRTLTGSTIGDSGSNWLEIAQTTVDGQAYSLIVRSNVITGTTAFGSSNDYSSSTVRTKVNTWFKSTTTISGTALLRDYTVKPSDLSVGTYGTSNPGNDGYGIFDGFSTPGAANRGLSDDDVCFLLSYGEAARFVSKQWYRNDISSWQASNSTAIANWNALADKSTVHSWFRSPGSAAGDASFLINNSGVVSSYAVGNTSVYARPALWVKSDIFE